MTDLQLFSLACREVLALQLENEKHKEFILDEASDYEITHFILEGDWPKDTINEKYITESLKFVNSFLSNVLQERITPWSRPNRITP